MHTLNVRGHKQECWHRRSVREVGVPLDILGVQLVLSLTSHGPAQFGLASVGPDHIVLIRLETQLASNCTEQESSLPTQMANKYAALKNYLRKRELKGKSSG